MPLFGQAIRIAATYAAFGCLWILLSDKAASIFFPLAKENETVQTVKGILFVLLSALLILLLIARALRKQHNTEKKLSSAEVQLRQLAENTSDLFYTFRLNPYPRIDYVSPSCLRITGFTQQEHYDDTDLRRQYLHPEDRPLLARALEKAPKEPFLLRWYRKDGRLIYLEHTLVEIHDAQGKLTGLAGIGRDVTEAQQARQDLELLNHAYTVLWQINRLVVREKNQESIFSEACQIPLSSGNFSLAWIGRIDRANNAVTIAATAGEKKHLEYLQQMHITLDDTPTGRGPTGMAARFGSAFCSSDIAGDNTMMPWRDIALAHGFRSSAAFPLKLDGEVTAVWTLYSPVPNYFSRQIQSLYSQLAGDISFALGVANTEAQKIQLAKELEISIERWRFALEATGDGLWDWNLENSDVFFSPTLPTMLGYTSEEWGDSLSAWQKRVHPEDQERVLAEIENHFAGKSSLYACEHRLLCKDGSYKWILDRGKVIERNAAGKPKRMIGLHTDISEQKVQREQALEREESLATLFSESPLGIAVVDTDTSAILTVNPKFCEILGRPADELLRLGWEDFTFPDDIAANENLLQEMRAGLRKGFTLRKRYVRPDGTLVWSQLTVAQLTHYHEARSVHIAIIDDVTQIVEREDHLNTIITEAPLGIAIIDSDSAELLTVNPKYCEITGRTATELEKLTWKQITYPDDIAADQGLMDELNAGIRNNFKLRKRLLHRDGNIVWISMTVARLTHYHEARRVHICLIEDISEMVRHEERMRLDSAVINNTRDGVVITNLEPRIVSVNRAYTEITGYAESEVMGKNPSIIKSGRQDAHFYREMWNEIKSTGRWQGELYNRRKNGEIYPQVSSIDTIYDSQGKPLYYVGVFSDMAKLKRTEESFERLAHYDILTGLPNRLMVNNRLSHAIDTAKRHMHSIAVLFMDLDHFKNVNDSLGHVAGDELLTQVALRLRRRLRTEDTIARLGGDEFLIVLENIEEPGGAAIVARDIIATFSEPFRLTTGHDVYSACSIGISLFPQDGETSTDLVRNADAALYLSKSEGRSTFRFYTNDLTAMAKRRLDLESQLRRALDNNELVVYYQPIVKIDSGEVVGAEALCRWFPAGQDAISPAEFIPVAEETGLIIQLGDFVLQTACRDAAVFHAKNPKFTTMAVNASVRQFQGAGWFEHIGNVLEKKSLPAGLLEIEVTESTIMNKGSEAIVILQRLRETGIRIAIDDFGTGYSSLSYLQRFAVNQLKIDQSFVREMTKNEASLQLVRTMIAMAKSLGLTTLAEGVETTEHLEILRAKGCTYYQGFLKSPAVPADKFLKDFL